MSYKPFVRKLAKDGRNDTSIDKTVIIKMLHDMPGVYEGIYGEYPLSNGDKPPTDLSKISINTMIFYQKDE